MAGFHLQAACAKYQGRLTEDCFMAGVPEWLRCMDDNTVLPSFALTDADGFKWLKFSSYDHSIGALNSLCHEYGHVASAGASSASAVASQLPRLRILVMPYAPTADAHQLHQLIVNPDLLPISYAEAVANYVAGGVGESQMHIAEEEEEDAPDPSASDERDGILTLSAADANINFTVTNYGLLWAKAEKFCVSTFLSDAFQEVLARFTSCDRLMHHPTSALLDTFEEDLQQAKWNLIFAMYLHGTNPHDMILLHEPAMHDQVYQDCVHCDSDVEDDDKLDSQDTMMRLYDELELAGLDDADANLSIDQARMQLMSAEGLVESYKSELNAIQGYNIARDSFRRAVMPLLEDFHVST